MDATVVEAQERILIFEEDASTYTPPEWVRPELVTEYITRTHINDNTLIRNHWGVPIDISELTPGTRVRLCLGSSVYQMTWERKDDPNYHGYETTYYECYEIRLQE